MIRPSRTVLRRSRRLLVVLLLGLAVLPVPAWAAEPAPDAGTARYEIRFTERMISHHAMAVEMATVCVANAAHGELRSLCQTILADQTREIEEMQAWLLECYGIAVEPESKRGDTRQIEQLAALAGAEFEIEFMDMMIRHHLQAVREASKCTERAHHEDLEASCEDIVTTQAGEIEQMRAWLCQWYGICQRRR